MLPNITNIVIIAPSKLHQPEIDLSNLNNLASWSKYNFHGYIETSYQIMWQAQERKKHAYIKQETLLADRIESMNYWSIDQKLIHIEKSYWFLRLVDI
jgi:hypothetical protein